ncbi:MAG: hypothetical protein ABIS38_02980 [Sphingomicrobium sp.]
MNEVWDSFDRRQKAKGDAADDGVSAGDGGEQDMFTAAEVGAE